MSKEPNEKGRGATCAPRPRGHPRQASSREKLLEDGLGLATLRLLSVPDGRVLALLAKHLDLVDQVAHEGTEGVVGHLDGLQILVPDVPRVELEECVELGPEGGDGRGDLEAMLLVESLLRSPDFLQLLKEALALLGPLEYSREKPPELLVRHVQGDHAVSDGLLEIFRIQTLSFGGDVREPLAVTQEAPVTTVDVGARAKEPEFLEESDGSREILRDLRETGEIGLVPVRLLRLGHDTLLAKRPNQMKLNVLLTFFNPSMFRPNCQANSWQ